MDTTLLALLVFGGVFIYFTEENIINFICKSREIVNKNFYGDY